MTADSGSSSSSHIWHPFTQMQGFAAEDPPFIASAEGFELIDVDGRRYLDGISSLWCNVHGHRVPEIDAAIRAQLDKVAHTTLLGLSHVAAEELAERLTSIVPPGLTRVFYSDAGATAVEAALKIAVQYYAQRSRNLPEHRTTFVRLAESYHGDTVGAMSVGLLEAFHDPFRRLLFPTLTVPSPGIYRHGCASPARWHQHCVDALAETLEQHASAVAAVILEPVVQGAAGILVQPPGYVRAVYELTRRHDVLLIADEVAVGFGRTGRLFACEHDGVSPDLMCLAKGLSGGYLPLAATLATDQIYAAFLGDYAERRHFSHGHTFTGNPLACAAAIASLDRFESAQVLANAQRIEQQLRDELAPLLSHPHVGEIRQQGTMVGIELVQNRADKLGFATGERMGHRVTLAARERGVIIRPLGNVVVLMPAPAMDAANVRRLTSVTQAAIAAVLPPQPQ